MENPTPTRLIEFVQDDGSARPGHALEVDDDTGVATLVVFHLPKDGHKASAVHEGVPYESQEHPRSCWRWPARTDRNVAQNVAPATPPATPPAPPTTPTGTPSSSTTTTAPQTPDAKAGT